MASDSSNGDKSATETGPAARTAAAAADPQAPVLPRQRLSAAEVSHLLDTHFPQASAEDRQIIIESITADEAVLRLKLHERHIRPGGTISGPTMFLLCDVAVYTLVLAELGKSALQAVTTNLNINFLSRPQPSDLIAKTRLLKLGRRLAVGEVEVYSDGNPNMVAHATATYAIPPKTLKVEDLEVSRQPPMR